MLGLPKRQNQEKEAIKRLYSELRELKPGSDEYQKAVDALEKIRGSKRRIDWTPIIVAGIGLTQIILILKHEEFRVIASKALNFVVRGRV